MHLTNTQPANMPNLFVESVLEYYIKNLSYRFKLSKN